MIGALGFTSPFLLLAFLALPALWLILRAVPPAPVRRFFPGVILLLGLKDADTVTDRTPWWLLLLRLAAIAVIILGLAGPVLNPSEKTIGKGPLLILMDSSWASAQTWKSRVNYVDGVLTKAGRNERPVAIVQLGLSHPPVFQSAENVRSRLAGVVPNSWEPTEDSMIDFGAALGDMKFETLWISDGVGRSGRRELLKALQRAGPTKIFETNRSVIGLLPPVIENGTVKITAQRIKTDTSKNLVVEAHGLDPGGNLRVLASLPLQFPTDVSEASGSLSLPAELQARISSFEIQDVHSAGTIVLSDDSLRRREVAFVSGNEGHEGLELLSPLHYLTRALSPNADILTGSIHDVLPANPDTIIFADIAEVKEEDQIQLLEWIEKGGLLVRFAGPRLAASDVSRREEHPLMPVRLRSGGRNIGGAMSWGAPKRLAKFSSSSLFFGLKIPDDARVSAQVVAQPDPTLSNRTIAQLSDGTPLVTRKFVGLGRIVLFHVTANAEWSNLPLSGLFVEMLSRLTVSSSGFAMEATDFVGTTWQPLQVLNGYGEIEVASGLSGVRGEDLVEGELGPKLRPGIYKGIERVIARNVLDRDTNLISSSWPKNVTILGLETARETPLTGALLALALFFLALDVIASLALSGKIRMAQTAVLFFAIALVPTDVPAQPKNDQSAVNATAELVLAYVVTGNRKLDSTSYAGLLGLSETLFFRTSVEPENPVGVDLEKDELSFYPLLYWPITPNQRHPSKIAYEKLNRYLRSGGMIFFDTRDADTARFGGASPNSRKLKQLAAPLDIPHLEPIPQDHVLTRAFYLLQDFPGRFAGSDVWVEAAPPDAKNIEGMPFRNLNDGVSPVVIGGNDWASAWAIDSSGNRLFPVGRGYNGERQREIAYRFGVNLVMHVLSGNYKSDQVHVPALLERLGQ